MLKQRLVRELGLLVTLKVLILAGLYFAFFGPDHRLNLGSNDVAAQLLSTTSRGFHN